MAQTCYVGMMLDPRAAAGAREAAVARSSSSLDFSGLRRVEAERLSGFASLQYALTFCSGGTNTNRGVLTVAGTGKNRLGARVRAERGASHEPVVEAGERREIEISRRNLFAAVAIALPLVRTPLASATSFRQYNDRFDGYSFSYPEGWIQVRGAGADVFFRDPVNLDENVVVEFSSPSSSRYESVEDLGTPEEAAQKILKQYLTEFMSTRIGVRRESTIMYSKSRIGEDGRLYYDIEVNVKSFANTRQLAVMPEDRVAKLEWSRRYLSVIGVENKRLYELRLQTPERVLLEEEPDLRQMMNSFRLVKLDA